MEFEAEKERDSEPSHGSNKNLGEISYSFLVAPESNLSKESLDFLAPSPAAGLLSSSSRPQHVDTALQAELQGIHDVLENYLQLLSSEVIGNRSPRATAAKAGGAGAQLSARLRQDSLGAGVRDSASDGGHHAVQRPGGTGYSRRAAIVALPVLLSPLLIGLLGWKIGLAVVVLLLVFIVCRI